MSASKPNAAPVSAATSSSTTSASIAPLVPPIGSIDPVERGLARRWSAGPRGRAPSPSGIGLPSFAATITLPRATSESERSIDKRRAVATRKHGGDRIGAEQRARPPAAAIAAGELPNASPTMPRVGHRYQVIGGDAEMMAVGDAGEAHAVTRGHGGSPRRRRARRRERRDRSHASTSTAPPVRATTTGMRVAVGAAVAAECVAYCGRRDMPCEARPCDSASTSAARSPPPLPDSRRSASGSARVASDSTVRRRQRGQSPASPPGTPQGRLARPSGAASAARSWEVVIPSPSRRRRPSPRIMVDTRTLKISRVGRRKRYAA